MANKFVRNSNMEMLRIIAMLLVMVVHASYLALGVPSVSDCVKSPWTTLFRFLTESVSVVCVDVFVMVSGYFGINWHKQKLASLFFQVVFFSILVFAILTFYDSAKTLNMTGVRHLLLLNGQDYWFIKSYLILYLFAPMLNDFVRTCKSRTVVCFLLIFYTLQTLFGWMSIYGINDFGGGYSALSFMGLYVFTRSVKTKKIDGNFFRMSSKSYAFIYFIIAVFDALLAFVITYIGYPVSGRIFTYTNPIIILQSFALLMTFAVMSPSHNKAINWVASSCLAVYLLHGNELFLRPIYGKCIRIWFSKCSFSTFFIKTSAFIIILFITAIFFDQLRKFMWNGVLKIGHKVAWWND